MPRTPKPKALPPSETMRKLPKQARARRTIEAIFEATAQLVDSEGAEALSTNKVAQKAGVSIGTLYQYFPTKEAIVVAMIAQERMRVMAELQSMLISAVKASRDPQSILRDRVRALLSAMGTGSHLNRAMVRLAWHMDHHEQVAQAQREGTEHLAIALAAWKDPSLRAPTPAMLFVATRAVIGVIRSASLENSALLGSKELEDELVRMVWRLVSVDSPG
ncbi:TetR/AcrR family transcriptional regulator [Aquabacterium sp.]|uniref:TetR/AcrR family transcriptional regulator n=1 Tax=Aquabacterium sp. TaxID=1872578 RepID=UPI003D6D99F1